MSDSAVIHQAYNCALLCCIPYCNCEVIMTSFLHFWEVGGIQFLPSPPLVKPCQWQLLAYLSIASKCRYSKESDSENHVSSTTDLTPTAFSTIANKYNNTALIWSPLCGASPVQKREQGVWSVIGFTGQYKLQNQHHSENGGWNNVILVLFPYLGIWERDQYNIVPSSILNGGLGMRLMSYIHYTTRLLSRLQCHIQDLSNVCPCCYTVVSQPLSLSSTMSSILATCTGSDTPRLVLLPVQVAWILFVIEDT